MVILNPNVSWDENEKAMVVYYRFSFYFLEGQAKEWFKMLLDKNSSDPPEEFLNYLKERELIF